MKRRVLDLFSGAGMFSLGLEWSGGFETKGFCEINPFPQMILKRHMPSVPVYPDIKELSGEQVGPIDVICGGFPCQDLSVAGKGAGLSGDRSGLWFDYLRLIGELRPKWVIVENVSALLGRGLGDVLRGLAEIGYDAEWHCIPLTYIGAPHNRDRIWIIAYPQRCEQPWKEPRIRALGRVGRIIKSVPWHRDWESALSEFRGMDDGDARSVDRTDLTRNSISPFMAQMIGESIIDAEGETE